MLRHAMAVLGLFSVTFAVGCGGGVKPEVVPPLEPVSGKVTLNGQPVAGVTVSFFPSDKGNPTYGATDAEGKYKLKYRTGAEGTPVGQYSVIFSKMALPDGSPIPDGQTAADAGAVEQIPEAFRSLSEPINVVTVPKGGSTFDFDIRS